MSSTTSVRVDRLEVPGASLYYEVRGSGPLLLMMPGGPADAGVFQGIAGEMATSHTVLTYDPRGLSHSELKTPVEDDRIVQIFADDAHRLVKANRSAPAFIFANSGGATIALELAVRHPDQIRTLVAHEPPSPALLPDPARARTEMHEVVETYRSAGVWPAMQKFMLAVGVKEPPPPRPSNPTAEMLEGMAMMQRNFEFFLGHYFDAIANYEPDFAALKKMSNKIISAVGADSTGELANQGGLGLAGRLGKEPVIFPGAHGGFQSHSAEFADKLRQVLED